MENEKLLKFINGECNLSQQKEVLNWINFNKQNKELFCQLKNLNTAAEISSVEIPAKNYKNIFKKIAINVAKVAAVLIIGLTIYNLGKKGEESKWVKNSAEQITEIKAPLGESVQLTLPDGTNIKLNCGSVLKFSNLFGYQDRVVELNGEGYFDVNKSNLKFVVATKELNLEVLGTKFNISAYDSDRIVNANLYEGKVAITNKILRERVVLNPSESYSYDKISKKSKYKTFNKDLTWLDNYFVADRDDIEEFVKKIERKYKVQIIIDPNLIGKCTYTGVFKGESLKEVLDNMVIASPIEYYLDDKGAVYINKRKTKI